MSTMRIWVGIFQLCLLLDGTNLMHYIFPSHWQSISAAAGHMKKGRPGFGESFWSFTDRMRSSHRKVRGPMGLTFRVTLVSSSFSLYSLSSPLDSMVLFLWLFICSGQSHDDVMEYVKVSCVRISTMHNGQLNIAMSEMFMKSVLGTDML